MYKAKKIFIVILFFISFISLKADKFSKILEAQTIADQFNKHYISKISDKFTFKWSGNTQAEAIYDTYQIVAGSDGELVLFPTQKSITNDYKDSSNRGSVNIWALHASSTLNIYGPDVLLAKTHAVINADFFGRTFGGLLATFSPNTLNEYYVRNAYFEMIWDKWTFLAGQSTDLVSYPSPEIINGLPMSPGRICPQFRVSYSTNEIDFALSFLGEINQADYGYTFPSDYLFEDSLVPEVDFYSRYKFQQGNFLGLGINLHRLLPRLLTQANYYERFPFFNTAVRGFSRFNWNNLSVTSEFTFAEDAEFLSMIGGYAVHSQNPVTQRRTYVPLRTISWWADFVYFYKDYIEPALFVGIMKNCGCSKDVYFEAGFFNQVPIVYGFGEGVTVSSNNAPIPGFIDKVLKVSPRVKVYFGPIMLGFELQYIWCGWGTMINNGTVTCLKPTQDYRIMTICSYSF